MQIMCSMRKQGQSKTGWLLLAMMLSCSCLTSQAQSVYDVNHDGKVDAADVTKVVSVIMGKSSDASVPEAEDAYLQSRGHNAVTIWKDGEATIIHLPDRVVLWNDENYVPEEQNQDISEIAEPTAVEQSVMLMASDEDAVSASTYTEQEFAEYDAMAKDLIAQYAEAEAGVRQAATRGIEEEVAADALRNNGKNIFPYLIIEQQDWDSGLWGKTRYGGKHGDRNAFFKTFWGTFWKDGKRYLEVVFYHEGGFPNNQTAYLKLGQVNSGKIPVDPVKITKGEEYGFLTVCLESYLPGIVNFFPLVITEGSKARYYLNPVCVKSDPIVPSGWADMAYGAEFGKINGVSVYCNTLFNSDGSVAKDPDTGKLCKNISGYKYQCVELCKRYVWHLNDGLVRKLSDTWGNAINWPYNRANDNLDRNRYIVYKNDGSMKIREGDLIVWDFGTYGHIGVVIKTSENYISVAHQNGGSGSNARPIGSTLKIENGIVRDIKPGSNKSPIFAKVQPITYLIRMDHPAEHGEAYSATLSASTTNMDFGRVKAGESVSKSFTIKNSGYGTLTISSMTLAIGKEFSIGKASYSIEHGQTQTLTVTFTPNRSGKVGDEIVIKSDAKDNPIWTISLSGQGYGDGVSADIPTDGLVAYYPFNGNANDESGYGNHGKVIGNVELTTDRHGNAKGAYRFFGKELNYISVADNASLHFSNFTLSAWVYTDATNYGSGYLINKGRDITNGSYRLQVSSVGAQTMYNGSNGVSMGMTPQTGVWHLVTGTVQGNTAKIYLDGKFVAEKTLSYSFSYNNSEPLTLGMHYYSGVPSYWAYPLLGVLDDVRIYNRVLTPSEIEALYLE